MLRAAGALLLVCGCTGCGLLAARRLKWRVELLWEFEAALELIERELSYADTDMPEILERLSGTRGAVGAFFSRCSARLAQRDRRVMEQIWREELESGGFPLSTEELELLLKVGSVLGRYDSAGQCQVLARVRSELGMLRTRAESDRDRLGRVYRAVGAAAGAGLAILLI